MGKITFSSDTEGFERSDLDATSEIAEEYFETKKDQDQVSPSEELKNWIYKNCRDYLNVIRDGEKIIGYSFRIPTSVDLMNSFLRKEINEKQLFEKVMNQDFPKIPQAIYLCSTIIKESYRGKGLAFEGSIKILEKFKKDKPVLFSWPFNESGKNLDKKISKISGLKLLIRQD